MSRQESEVAASQASGRFSEPRHPRTQGPDGNLSVAWRWFATEMAQCGTETPIGLGQILLTCCRRRGDLEPTLGIPLPLRALDPALPRQLLKNGYR